MPLTLPQTAQGARLPQNYRPPGTNTISQSPQIPGQPWRKNTAGNLSGSNITGNSYGSPTVGNLNLPRTNPTYRPPPGPPPATYGSKGIPANSYNHPQAAAFQPPRPNPIAQAANSPYGTGTRPNLPRPALQPRPRALPRAVGNIPKGVGGRAIAGGAGAVANGAIAAGLVLANGGSVPEAIGAGVGSGVGSAIGMAAGAAAGAALGPVGAIVGGAIGSAIGGTIGGAIGQGLGDLVDGPDLPTEAIASGAAPPSESLPFTGGQGEGVRYRVSTRVSNRNPVCCWSPSGVFAGPILGISYTQTTVPPFANPQVNLLVRTPLGVGVAQGWVTNLNTPTTASLSPNVAREDGLPDEDGDLPAPAPVRAPMPRLSPALPTYNPLTTFPGIEAAPSPVPEGDKPPTLEPAPQPGEAPAITPDNAPAIAPVPLPMPAPKGGPQTASGTATAPRTEIGDPTKNQTTPPPGKQKQYPTNPGGCGCNAPIIKNQQAILSQMGSQAQTQQVDLSDVKARLTRIEGNQNNPVTGFAALQTGQVGILGLVNTLKTFLEKAWETTRLQKVLNAFIFVGVMHNVLMLSRDVGETFGYLIGNMLNVFGIEDEEGNSIDVINWFGNTVESTLRSLLGDDLYEGTRDAWNKASSVLRAASMVIWTVRSIMDSSLDLMEWIGENTGKIGNALKRYGVVGERSYRWMAERAQVRNRFRSRFDRVTNTLENAEDVASSFSTATSNVLEIQQETGELAQNSAAFVDTLRESVPDPWEDNQPIADEAAAAAIASESPDITANDADRG